MAIFSRSCSFAAERLVSGLLLAIYVVSVRGSSDPRRGYQAPSLLRPPRCKKSIKRIGEKEVQLRMRMQTAEVATKRDLAVMAGRAMAVGHHGRCQMADGTRGCGSDIRCRSCATHKPLLV
jgi:hypothetical protein